MGQFVGHFRKTTSLLMVMDHLAFPERPDNYKSAKVQENIACLSVRCDLNKIHFCVLNT